MKIPLFDCHADTLWRLHITKEELAENSGHLDIGRISRYAPRAQVLSLWGESPDAADKCLAVLEREFSKNEKAFRLCLDVEDIKTAARENALAVLLSVEGAELIGCREADLEKAFAAGVRMVNITWNDANELCGSCVDESHRGLSRQGRAYFQKMQSMGIIADMSHISYPGFFHCAELAVAPIIASHSNSHAVCPHPRNLTDEQFAHIVRLGGVAGINLYAPFLGDDPDTETVFAHIEHFCSLGGEKNVAVGADFDGCDELCRGINGVQDMEKIYELLLRKNYPESTVRDIFYNNMMRVIENVLRQHKR
ncbi:MAG: membrane dipeptidase [Oscillospiraceae bacterium]|nr:membrane dipeptidase [Oscillospiraceae bacterium]